MLHAGDCQQLTPWSSENTASPRQSPGADTALIIVSYPISHHPREPAEQQQTPDLQNTIEILRPKGHLLPSEMRNHLLKLSDGDSFKTSP